MRRKTSHAGWSPGRRLRFLKSGWDLRPVATDLYFSAGPNGEGHRLFRVIQSGDRTESPKRLFHTFGSVNSAHEWVGRHSFV